MNNLLRMHADEIIKGAIAAVMPDDIVKRALDGRSFRGRVRLAAVGKAAWRMAKSAAEILQDRIEAGVVLTKYGHVEGAIANYKCFEAGHPIPDANSFMGTQAIIDLVSDLGRDDTLLFLLSGGGSALFEQPLIQATELRDINLQLLACGADIVEINTIRKRLSLVKGGRFAKLCYPAHIEAIVISDIIGDPLDMIASGPVSPDQSTSDDAKRIVDKYGLKLSSEALQLMNIETPKHIDNVEASVYGGVNALCMAAAGTCERLGYSPFLLTDELCCQAKEAGSFLASILRTWRDSANSIAFIAGGETVVKLTGKGKGGRNQELALAAASGIAGIENAAVFSIGSDGTDGPTDVAGGYVDGDTYLQLCSLGISIDEMLLNNDSYSALEKTGGLLFTGPTGTNVNDVSVALLKAK